MAAAPYESLVGWRYLLRLRRRPGVLIVGLLMLVVGGGLAAYAFGEATAGVPAAVYAGSNRVFQILLGVGGGLAAAGFCVALFGLLNTFLTTFSAFSAFMVTIGVAEVIVVLGVMNGFQADLRNKIIDTKAHIVIEPPKGERGFENYRELTEKAAGVEGVTGAAPYLSTEVMLSSRSNLAYVVLQGIEPETIGKASKVPQFIKCGGLQSLTDPDNLGPFDPEVCPDLLLDIDETEDRIQRHLDEESRKRAEARAADEDAPPEDPSAEDAEAAELEAFGMALPKPKKPGKPPVVLIGQELFRNLHLWPGESLNVISPFGELGPNGPVPKSRPFRFGGFFDTGMLEFDSHLAYGGLAEVQKFMGVGDIASAIQVRVVDLEAAREIRDRLRAALPPELRITDWQERNRNLFNALKLEKVAMFLVLSINILLSAFAIIATLVMTILERRREIAILMAMGAAQGSVQRIFLAQGAFTGLVGSLLGATVGLAGGLALSIWELPMNTDVYYITAIPVDLRVADVLSILAVAWLVSVLSTVYPARYASRLKPVEGLTGG